MDSSKTITIAGASGYWGDSPIATPQLLAAGGIDYLVYDYLAEITMSIMARAKATDSSAGYAKDFVTVTLKNNLAEIAKQNIKVISNAGGINPRACGDAIKYLVEELGLDLKVAVVTGDDLLSAKSEFINTEEMFSGEKFPNKDSLASINAYLGAFPIAKALEYGADIVITGRCVDSAVTLAACIYEFGWAVDDWDLLASGTLAGHLIECGIQVTGGNFTDWTLAENLDQAGYPVIDIKADGDFEIYKPENTGGVVNIGTVSEQLVYEIGDPTSYIVADVVCDFTEVNLQLVDDDRVKVWGAKGYPATDSYKVSATYHDGWRGGALYSYTGIDADKKAKAFADLIIKRSRKTLNDLGLGDFVEISSEVLGNEDQYGSYTSIDSSREVVLKLAARHENKQAINVFLKTATELGLSAPPGLCIYPGSRSKASPVVRLFSFLISKEKVSISINSDDSLIKYSQEQHAERSANLNPETKSSVVGFLDELDINNADLVDVPLIELAWARSGDKGNKANIGVIARSPEYLPYIAHSLTAEVVEKRFTHFIHQGNKNTGNTVNKYILPGIHALNFLIDGVLGGGGMASLRNDVQGKAYAQILLDQSIKIPCQLAEKLADASSNSYQSSNPLAQD